MRAFETEKTEVAEIDRSVYDIKDKVNAAFEVNSGLTAEIVEQISKEKHDPDWMREFRLKALDIYNKASIPNWGPSLEGLDMRNIVTYVRPNTEMRGKWSEVPDDIKNTFERLGIPQAERSSLAGVGAQYDSEVVYHNVKEEVAAQGVVYTDMESAMKGEYADMVRKSNYSDIFLVDLNGDVVYSVTKHANFATNLLSGPYQSSGLGNTFAKIKRRLDGGQKPQQIFEFTDFGRNELTGQVVAYLAAPVMQYDYVRGVVIFELLPDKLNQIMAEREGLGETGETILIGPDKRMRANAWLAPEFSVENSFSPNFRPLQTPLIIKALSGEQGVGPFLSYHDDEVLAAYTQVKVFDTEWAFIAEISTSEAYAPIRQLETLVILLGAGSLLLLILFSRWLSHSITAPLRSLTAAAEQVADGALDHPITIPRTDDDIDRLAQAFRHMQRSVKDKIELIERQTQELQQQVKLTHKQNLSLQQADKLKDELLANTSHELRTPIHGIKGMAESMLASQQDLTEGQQKQHQQGKEFSEHRFAF